MVGCAPSACSESRAGRGGGERETERERERETVPHILNYGGEYRLRIDDDEMLVCIFLWNDETLMF